MGLFVFATYSSNGSGNNTIGTVKVWGTLPKEAMNATLTSVTQVDEGMKNVSYVEKDPSTLPADLAAAIATETAPDLVLASQEELFALAKFIAPIGTDTISASTFTSTFVDEGNLFTAPGGAGYFGIPFLVDPLVLFWNNNILSSSGIAKPPATWEALIGLMPNVAVLTPSKQVTRGLIALGTYDNVHNARGILSALFLQTNVPMVRYSAGGVLSADLGEQTGGGVPTGEAVVGFYTQFADPSKVSYTWNSSEPDSQQAFGAGDLALYLGYASEVLFLRATNPNLAFSVAPLPQPVTALGKGTYGLVYAFMIPRGVKNPTGAYQAAALFTNSAEQDIAAKMTGLAPATRGALSTAPADPTAVVAYTSALYAKGWLSPAPLDVDKVFSSMIGDVVSGRSMSDTAVSNAARSLTSLLQP